MQDRNERNEGNQDTPDEAPFGEQAEEDVAPIAAGEPKERPSTGYAPAPEPSEPIEGGEPLDADAGDDAGDAGA